MSTQNTIITFFVADSYKLILDSLYNSRMKEIDVRLEKALQMANDIYVRNERNFNEAYSIGKDYYNLPSGKRKYAKQLIIDNLPNWSYKVKLRDMFRCRKCFGEVTQLASHHIKNKWNYPSLALDLNNGITLCRRCHYDFHLKYGRFKNSFEQLKEFLYPQSPTSLDSCLL